MGYLSGNIKHLRKQKGLTQEDLANKLGIKRPMIASYEEERAEPKLATLQSVADYFAVSIDDLLNRDLRRLGNKAVKLTDIEGKGLRVLTNVVDRSNKELITLVPVHAAAGYLNGYADPEFIEHLPSFHIPVPELAHDRTYRVFQIKGDSMLPVVPGSYIFSEYVQNWKDVKDGRCYIVITKDDGIVYKRVYSKISEEKKLLLKSDNPDVDSYKIDINNVIELWKALGYISFELPEPQKDTSVQQLSRAVEELKQDINRLKKKK